MASCTSYSWDAVAKYCQTHCSPQLGISKWIVLCLFYWQRSLIWVINNTDVWQTETELQGGWRDCLRCNIARLSGCWPQSCNYRNRLTNVRFYFSSSNTTRANAKFGEGDVTYRQQNPTQLIGSAQITWQPVSFRTGQQAPPWQTALLQLHQVQDLPAALCSTVHWTPDCMGVPRWDGHTKSNSCWRKGYKLNHNTEHFVLRPPELRHIMQTWCEYKTEIGFAFEIEQLTPGP